MASEVLNSLPGWDDSIVKWLREADELRASIETPEADASHAQLIDTLVVLRRAMDRVEAMLRNVAVIRARSDQRVADAQAAYDDEWDDAARGAKLLGQKWDNAAPRERYAKYALATMESKVDLREAERLHRQINTAFEVLKMVHRGMESVRWSIDARIRAVTIDTRLES